MLNDEVMVFATCNSDIDACVENADGFGEISGVFDGDGGDGIVVVVVII